MKGTGVRSTSSGRARLRVLVAAAVILVLLGALAVVRFLTLQSRQAEVAARGAQIMPFDLERTIHVFHPLDDGGLQQVIAKDPADTGQIAMIQAHVREEAERFGRGDFGDPASIHGRDMPGLAALQAGAARVSVRYVPLSNGAQIRYTTTDPALVAALHQWFAAQVSDHGPHAAEH